MTVAQTTAPEPAPHGGYRVDRITSSRDAGFAAAYDLLDAQFGPRWELERREVIEQWLDAPEPGREYVLLLIRDAQGAPAAVRDAHIVHMPRVTVLYLAHVLVTPAHRRRGLAKILRDVPTTLARQLSDVPLLTVGEMEYPDPADDDSIVRLIAYGRAGFRALDPRIDYQQPDFTDPAERGEAEPVRLLCIVDRDAESLDRETAREAIEALYRVFATHCLASETEPLRTHSLRAIDAMTRVSLLRLPRDRDDPALAALTPIAHAHLP